MVEEIKKGDTGGRFNFSPVFLLALMLLAVAVGLGVALIKEKARSQGLEEKLNSAILARAKAETDLGGLKSEKIMLEKKLKDAESTIEGLAQQLTIAQISPLRQGDSQKKDIEDEAAAANAPAEKVQSEADLSLTPSAPISEPQKR